MNDHDHRGEYAAERHDHDPGYAGKDHRHHGEEAAVSGLLREVRELRQALADALGDLREVRERLRVLEDQLPEQDRGGEGGAP